MNDPPQLLKPNRLSWGHSPTRPRVSDDILVHITPATAVDALSSTTGPLKGCLDGASAAERDFALRTAVASKSIWEWADELGEWHWPTEGGPAGFQDPSKKPRGPAVHVTAPEGTKGDYMGSLLADDVARYEAKIEKIYRDMEELDIEEIKRHVLTNHIMPLSRPGTPASISSRSGMSSVPNYNKMEDLSAVITAIVVQTLPNLARLSNLLQIWSIRISILQRIPRLLTAIQDAEVALKSGWNAVALPAKETKPSNTDDSTLSLLRPESTLKRDDFEIMRRVIAKKISKPGRTLDYMLDCLEGLQDTLPDQWLDRMEAAEQDYSEWAATCERKIREAGWAKTVRLRLEPPSPSPQSSRHGDDGSSSRSADASADDTVAAAAALRAAMQPDGSEEPKAEMEVPDAGKTSTATGNSQRSLKDTKPTNSADDPAWTEHPILRKLQGRTLTSYDGIRESAATSSQAQPPVSTAHEGDDSSSPETMDVSTWSMPEDAREFDHTMSPVEEMDELELPPLAQNKRRASDASVSSIVEHGASHQAYDLSSDLPEVSASPGIPRTRVHEAEYAEDSPPSSPPIHQADDTRESSVALLDSPMITSIPEDDESMFINTPVDGSFADDFDDSYSISEITSPMNRRESSGDQQLRQQISQIIESIPAKIKLSSETPAINLNPPDLQLPRLKKKPSKEPFKRSASGLSSRTATPSFTLSPAKNSRPRHQRGQQEIKVYHLSRSTGEPPIKLFIRCVGEHGERVMVRVGGGWADLSEYLKDYASHHKRRSAGTDQGKVEIRDLPQVSTSIAANSSVIFNSELSPASRPGSAAAEDSPITPLNVRKTRRSLGAANSEVPRLLPKTPGPSSRPSDNAPSSEESARSRSSSRLSWVEGDSSFLGLAGPSGKKVEMSDENKAWVESVKQKVRLASGERKVSAPEEKKRFGELGKVGGTKRLFRKKDEGRRDARK